MGEVLLSDNITTVTLTDDNPEVRLISDQLVIDFQLIGTDTGEVEDLGTFTDVIIIQCIINDITKFNGLQTIRKSSNDLVFSWNSTDAVSPNINHTNSWGRVNVKISNIALSQKPGVPTTIYEMRITLKTDIDV